MQNESLEEKVERLEYYIDLLRDYIVDQETFILWDWAISHRLNREEVRNIINISKDYNEIIKDGDSKKTIPGFEEYISKVREILSSNPNLNAPINEKFVITLLKRISKMGMFNSLTNHYLNEK